MLLISILIAASSTAYAAGPPDQWVAAGLQGQTVSNIVIDPVTPSTLYAITNDGLFKSTDHGKGWEKGQRLNGPIIAFAIDPVAPSTLYAGTSRGLWPNEPGMFKSYDGAENWEINKESFTGRNVGSLAIDPQAPSTIYAGAWLRFDGDIYKSLDGGATWQIVKSCLPDSVSAIAVDPLSPSTIYAGTIKLILSESIGVLKSTDSGSNWVPMNTGLGGFSVDAIGINPLTPSTVYVVTLEGGIYRSTDAGNNWVAINNGMDDFEGISLSIDPAKPATLYSGTLGGGIYKSIDSGNYWTPMNNGLGNLDVFAIAVDPVSPSILYAGTSDGVYSIVVSAAQSDGDNSHNNRGCFIRTASR
jgi:photosystem II stability/assembly factor-like uncharacterized protein